MADQVKLPVVGATNKRVLYIGGGAALLLMGVLYLRKKQTAVTPAAATATDPNSTDTSGLDTSGGFFTGGGAGVGGGAIGGVTAFVSNAQWFAAAMQQLAGVVDQTALASALGKYLTGQAVTPDEESIIDQARAAEGDPPVAGPNGYPPALRTQPSNGQTPPPPPPPPSGGGGMPASGDWTTHTTVHEGERLSQVLAYGGGMSQADFEAHNPGITQYYRWMTPGKGYEPGNAQRPGDVIVLNTVHDVVVLVKSGGW